jgi:hypothetical protein
MVQCHKHTTKPSGLHFLKGDDRTHVLVCIQELEALTEHAIASVSVIMMSV